MRAPLLLALAPLPALAAPDTTFFESRIRPVLAAECVECHGPEKQKGGLRLDWRGGWTAGGDSGAAIKPGDPDGSLLLQSIRHDHADLKMPKEGAKLDARVIADFTAWIRDGAPDPRDQPATPGTEGSWEEKFALRKQWWCFQPVTNPAPPPVKQADWARDPADIFLLAAMEARGLAPAADADPRAWLRRVTLALTGLPPTLEEIDAFLADSSPQARAAVVDRLLDSPRFGERWARHWLDLFRFAETHGSEGDTEIPNAWRYRDYVIRAVNGDVPLDQLIREHVAGDLLPAPRVDEREGLNESILGTAAIPIHEHGFQPVDTLDEQTRAVENQIDTVFKSFQALTVACARCHDHKFDPVSQRDYTALTGVFASSRPAQNTVDLPARAQGDRDALRRTRADLRDAVARQWRADAERFSAWLTDTGTAPARLNAMHATLDDLRRARAEEAASLAARHPQAGRADVPAPIRRWDFLASPAGAELLGGARVENGRLILDGKDDALQSEPLAQDLGERTLEAWVHLADLNQSGGGVVTVETTGGAQFDAIVFAEKHPRRWVAGSDFFRRGRPENPGADETASPVTAVQVAATYAADGTIALFRNGEPYGPPYRPDHGLVTYKAGNGRILLGRRHTGGGNAFLKGEIEEARVYDRALTAEQIAASFRAGPDQPGGFDRARVPSAELARLDHLDRQITVQQSRVDSETTGAGGLDRGVLLREARANPAHALHVFALLSEHPASAWPDLVDKLGQLPAPTGQVLIAPTDASHATWFRHGSGLAEPAFRAGEFVVGPDAARPAPRLLPAGTFTASVSTRQNGVFTSPRFLITTDRLYLRAAGGGGAQVRLIVDNYPLGVNNTFPKVNLEKDEPGWITFDTAYRKGFHAYLEFTTAGDATRAGGREDKDGRSWFWVGEARAGGPGDTPRSPTAFGRYLLVGEVPETSAELAARHAAALRDAVEAWRAGTASADQAAWLEACRAAGLLTAAPEAEIAPLLAAYRQAETSLPALRRAPGLAEGTAFDAPFLDRGDHKHPGEPVPRGFPRVLGGVDYAAPDSGRRQLAQDLTAPENPLTARVMANRIWQHLFGRGIVPTADNFGRLGELPTHPELLDHLATRLQRSGWSRKQLIRELVLSRAYAMDSAPSAAAKRDDPANQWLSHFPLRRLEAEAVRDSLLALSGKLDLTMHGPGAGENSPRRSVYLTIRRNDLPDFLGAFDFPPPTHTRGVRDATNVPAQSLALLNAPFVHTAAAAFADREPDNDRLFTAAFGRPPSPAERGHIQAYLAAGATRRDLALSFFNAKEFVYVR